VGSTKFNFGILVMAFVT